MDSMFSFKDLEKVTLKATYSMKIGDREIVPGEVIAMFDKLQIANMNEVVSQVSANGGKDNRAHVYWVTTHSIQLSFIQGVFSKDQFSLMTNAHLIGPAQSTGVKITEQEILESDEEGTITLKHTPLQGSLFIYNEETGSKITTYSLEDNAVTIEDKFLGVVVVYTYEYLGNSVTYHFGQKLFEGFVELEGRTRVKDDVTGQVVTGIFKVPKLRLMSDLSIRLGPQASPVTGSFRAEGIPVGSKGSSYVSEFFILSDDIESDL